MDMGSDGHRPLEVPRAEGVWKGRGKKNCFKIRTVDLTWRKSGAGRRHEANLRASDPTSAGAHHERAIGPKSTETLSLRAALAPLVVCSPFMRPAPDHHGPQPAPPRDPRLPSAADLQNTSAAHRAGAQRINPLELSRSDRSATPAEAPPGVVSRLPTCAATALSPRPDLGLRALASTTPS